jgi:glycosyltransferase involved in cell wall biosynthesis
LNDKGKPKGKVCHLGMATSIHVQRWVNHFAKEGWEVDLITFEPAAEGALDPNVRQHVVKTGNIPLIGFIRALLGVRKNLKKIRPNLIHAHSIPAYGIYAGLYSKMGGKEPIVVSAWGFHHIKAYKGIKRRLDRLCVNKARIVACTSWQMKDALVKSFRIPKDIFVIFSWGIDTNIFYENYQEEVNVVRKELGIENGCPIIISPRNMSSYYRIENIIMAASKVLKNHPRTVYIFLKGFGSEDFENQMKDKVKSLGIEKNVIFISKLLSPKEMAIYLNLSDIFISISKTDQMSSVILEGMACGSIPILSDIEIYKTHIEHGKNGFFVDGENVNEVCKTISYCINHPELKEGIIPINKVLIAEKEDWYKNAKKMEEIYDRVLK